MLNANAFIQSNDALSSGECPSLDHDPKKLYFGLFICLGLAFSYFPQFVRFYTIKSSIGVSPFYLLLGGLGCAATTANVFLLQQLNFHCCQSHWSRLICIENTMAFTQVAIQLTCFLFMTFLYYFYFPREYPSMLGREWRNAKMALRGLATGFSLIVLSMINAMTFLERDTLLIANYLGLFSGLAAILQFMPQIYKTTITRTTGALSVSMLLIQCPGSFLFLYTISIQPGTNWTSWITYLFGGIFQGILILICLFWAKVERIQEVVLESGEEGEHEETSPLLAHNS